MNIGLLVIATRAYKEFVAPLLANLSQRFFPEDEVTVHLFSEEPHEGTTWHGIEALRFPMVTLRRYSMFSAAAEALAEHDYLYYLDVDSRLEKVVGSECLPQQPGIVALHHTGFAAGSGAWEARPNYSWAYVSDNDRRGRVYFMGGFNGGTAPEFLAMASELAAHIERDIERNAVAVWHDESYLNRWLIDHPPVLVLPQGFSGREGFVEFGDRTITWLAKEHDKVRA